MMGNTTLMLGSFNLLFNTRIARFNLQHPGRIRFGNLLIPRTREGIEILQRFWVVEVRGLAVKELVAIGARLT